jgi:hypothetical protein
MLLSLMQAVAVASAVHAPADRGDEVTLLRLRTMDPSIRATIDEGCRRSPTFAALVRDLERSTFIVYVEHVRVLRDGMRGTLLHGGGGPQYLRVLLKRGMSLHRRVVVLAHELQHAREVVEAGIAADAVEMDGLFRLIGEERSPGGHRQRYETAAALRVTTTVAAELRARRGTGQKVDRCLEATDETLAYVAARALLTLLTMSSPITSNGNARTTKRRSKVFGRATRT